MPTYEYQCLDCGRKVDYFQSMHEPPVTVCPVCTGRLTRLVSSGTGLIFKGSGFYITDYKRVNASGDSGSNGKASLTTDAGAPKSKPAEKKSSDEAG